MRRKLLLIAVLLLGSGPASAAPPVEYTVKLADARRHLVHVRIHLPEGAAERDLQMPVWNALYQVRDFAQYVVERELPLSFWAGAGGTQARQDHLADFRRAAGGRFRVRHRRQSARSLRRAIQPGSRLLQSCRDPHVCGGCARLAGACLLYRPAQLLAHRHAHGGGRWGRARARSGHVHCPQLRSDGGLAGGDRRLRPGVRSRGRGELPHRGGCGHGRLRHGPPDRDGAHDRPHRDRLDGRPAVHRLPVHLPFSPQPRRRRNGARQRRRHRDERRGREVRSGDSGLAHCARILPPVERQAHPPAVARAHRLHPRAVHDRAVVRARASPTPWPTTSCCAPI